MVAFCFATFKIVCFGDSVTWGYDPDKANTRLVKHERWVNILETKLNTENSIEYEVIGEGLNGRTIDQIDETQERYTKYNCCCWDAEFE